MIKRESAPLQKVSEKQILSYSQVKVMMKHHKFYSIRELGWLHNCYRLKVVLAHVRANLKSREGQMLSRREIFSLKNI